LNAADRGSTVLDLNFLQKKKKTSSFAKPLEIRSHYS
jgi:hypothetical protein